MLSKEADFLLICINQDQQNISQIIMLNVFINSNYVPSLCNALHLRCWGFSQNTPTHIIFSNLCSYILDNTFCFSKKIEITKLWTCL